MSLNKDLFKNVKTIFFDYDGTLHNSLKIYGPAFRMAYSHLVERGLVEPKEWLDGEISYWLGFNPKDMWEKFMPDLDPQVKALCSKLIGEEMESLINAGMTELYEGAEDVLKYLKWKGYTLVFISNCKVYYKDSHCRLFNLNRYFDEILCSEEFDYIPKDQILKQVIDKYAGEMVVIGDRRQDMEAGWNNNLHTIGCRYGFSLEGELDGAEMFIDDIRDLLHIL